MRHIPKKRFGQNFLHDPDIIRSLVAAIRPQPDDLMVEIGPGLGALTQPLLRALDHLHVVELDRDIISWMQGHYPADKITIHSSDALKFDFAALGNHLRVVGNLPYNISTPLLFHFLRYRDAIHDLHLMLQKEVAERMTAVPGSKTYGRLTVMLAPWTDMECCFDIGPGAFSPPPKVRSTLVRIVPRRQPKFVIADQAAFATLVALAFSMRRKTLRRILKGRLTESELADAGFEPMARPETLSPAEFARLSEMTG
jgi:16S rRNA (adenine1518-N6/adenine1519-N6)-dimethyltransferase